MNTRNLDLNIWDKAGYGSEGEEEGWIIVAHDLVLDDDFLITTGNEIESLALTRDEWKILSLGVSLEDGGYYAEDSDFWLDALGFMETYPVIPPRVSEWLRKVMSEEGNLGWA